VSRVAFRHPLAVFRWLASADWKVQFPLWLEGPADASRSALQQCISYALQCAQRITVDALRGDDLEPPAHLVEFLASVWATDDGSRLKPANVCRID
jgi:hypothetical protein